MSVESVRPPSPGRPARSTVVASLVGVLLFVAILVAGLTWAKWWPYSHKLAAMLGTHAYPGSSVLDAAGAPGAAPSWHAAWGFAVTYGRSVWVALVVALLVAAGVESLVPRARLVHALRERGRLGGPLVAGALSVPCMMCTCCTAPLTVSMRRSGVPASSALAYWLGNPTLNPAVLAFLVIVLPWQYAATRVVIGVVLVVGVSALVGRLAPSRLTGAPAALAGAEVAQGWTLRQAPGRFARALARLVVVLVPEYAVVVLAVGAFRGWLLPLGNAGVTWGIGAVLVAAVAGTLLVIPTGGEIPVITGLVAAGFGAGVTGALLIALPALSLPSMAMVGRALSWRVTLTAGASVAVAALAGAALLTALGG